MPVGGCPDQRLGRPPRAALRGGQRRILAGDASRQRPRRRDNELPRRVAPRRAGASRGLLAVPPRALGGAAALPLGVHAAHLVLHPRAPRRRARRPGSRPRARRRGAVTRAGGGRHAGAQRDPVVPTHRRSSAPSTRSSGRTPTWGSSPEELADLAPRARAAGDVAGGRPLAIRAPGLALASGESIKPSLGGSSSLPRHAEAIPPA
jgi:hypothetical protein